MIKRYFSGALILRIFAITPSYDLNFFQHINHLKSLIFLSCATPLSKFEERQNRFCHGITFLNMNCIAQSWNLQVADFLLRISSYFVHLISNELEWMIICTWDLNNVMEWKKNIDKGHSFSKVSAWSSV